MKRGQSVISKSVREEISNDPEYERCGLQNLLGELIGPCAGRVTREHALIYAGSKIQDKWAIIPCCAKHHGVDQFQDGPGEAPKEVRVWVALNRATDEELMKYSKAINYKRERDRLNTKYGIYVSPPIKKPLIQKGFET